MNVECCPTPLVACRRVYITKGWSYCEIQHMINNVINLMINNS